MTNGLRALIIELADELDHNRQCLMDDRRLTHPLADKARAALSESKPELPTNTELKQLFDDHSGYINDEQVMWWSDFHAAARAVLARWGS